MKTMSGRSVTIRRAPSLHCRDARVYRFTATAINYNEYTPALAPAPRGGKNPGVSDWLTVLPFGKEECSWRR